MAIRSNEYCCGFLWRNGCLLYIIIDIISCILALGLYGQVVDVYRHPDDLKNALLRMFTNAKVPSKPKIGPSTNEFVIENQRLILERIISGCGTDNSNVDPEFIYKKLVVSMIVYAVGTIGFLLTAFLLLLTLLLCCKRDKWCLCETIMGMEVTFLITTIAGCILFNAHGLCPIDHSVEGFPRQKIATILTAAVTLYKVHEIYTVFRYTVRYHMKQPSENETEKYLERILARQAPKESLILTKPLPTSAITPPSSSQNSSRPNLDTDRRKTLAEAEMSNFRNEFNNFEVTDPFLENLMATATRKDSMLTMIVDDSNALTSVPAVPIDTTPSTKQVDDSASTIISETTTITIVDMPPKQLTNTDDPAATEVLDDGNRSKKKKKKEKKKKKKKKGY